MKRTSFIFYAIPIPIIHNHHKHSQDSTQSTAKNQLRATNQTNHNLNTNSLNSPLPILLPLIRNRSPHTIRDKPLPPSLRTISQRSPHLLRALRGQEPSTRAEVRRTVVAQEIKELSGTVNGSEFIFECRQGRGVFLVEGWGLHVPC